MLDAPTVDPEAGSVSFEYERSRYTLVLDMKAVAFFEREADMSLVQALAELETAVEKRQAPKVSLLAYLMQAGLRRHHPEVSAERALRMAHSKAVQDALGLAVKTAAPPAKGDDQEGEQSSRPTRKRTSPKPRKGRSKPA